MAHIFTNNVDLSNTQLLNAVLQQLAGDPGGLGNGHLYYNTASNTFKGKKNGSYVTLLTSGDVGLIDHDSLLNFVANEHVDHSSVSLTISGTTDQITVTGAGGDITSSRSWTLSLPQNIHTAADVQFGSATLSKAGAALSVRNTTDTASNQVGVLSGGDRATPANGDAAYISLQNETDAEALAEYARITWSADDVAAASKDGSIVFSVQVANSLTSRLTINSTGVAATGALTLDGTGVVLTTRTISTAANSGLSGGGDLSTNRSLAIDIPSLTAEASPNSSEDYGIIYEATSGQNRKVLLSNWPGGGGHTQNTDTGTTSTTFDIDSGGTGVRLKNSTGELQLRNLADNAYADLRVNNLVVTGTTTTVNSETVTVDDNIIVLNNNESGAPTEDAGIEIERGTSANAQLLWDESADQWVVNDGANTFSIVRKYTESIGDGIETDIAVTHNLNTKDISVSLRRNSDDAIVYADVVATSTTVATISFAVAPTTNQYTVIITG